MLYVAWILPRLSSLLVAGRRVARGDHIRNQFLVVATGAEESVDYEHQNYRNRRRSKARYKHPDDDEKRTDADHPRPQ